MTSAPLPHQVCPPQELAARLLAGQAGLMPTDTLPALAALPRHAAQIWELKRRPQEKPLILMVAGIEQLQPLLGLAWKPQWLALAGRAWPGALTLVLPAQGPLAEALNPGRGSLGLRIPACAAARELLQLTGPLATTSANPSGEPAATTAAEAAACFPQLALLGPLPWPPASGQASTVLAWDGDGDGDGAWQLLRSGAVPFPLPSPMPSSQPSA